MSSQPPWETQIQPGWGAQPQPPEQPRPPQQDGGWNQGSYGPPQPPQAPPRQPAADQVPPQFQPPYPPPGGQVPAQFQPPYPQFPPQPAPPQFTPPQMPGMMFPGDEPPSKNNTGRVVAMVLALVVLLGAAGGIYVYTKSGKSTDKAQPATKTTSTAAPTTTASASASFPDNSYTSSAAPSTPASSAGGPASLDNAATDKTPFTAAALVTKTFNDDKNVTYTLKYAQAQPCAKVGDAAVQKIVTSVRCGDLMAAAWIDPDNNRIVVSAMVIPYQDAATAMAIYKKLSVLHASDYSQWCPPAGQPGGDTCTKLAKAGTVTREGRFAAFHRYLLITTAVFADLRNQNSQSDWLTAAALGAFRNTLPGL